MVTAKDFAVYLDGVKINPFSENTIRKVDRLSEKDFIGIKGTCKACGSDVEEYLCNEGFIKVRPEAARWDWWAVCQNVDCQHHHGEGVFQSALDWVVKKPLPRDSVQPQHKPKKPARGGGRP